MTSKWVGDRGEERRKRTNEEMLIRAYEE